MKVVPKKSRWVQGYDEAFPLTVLPKTSTSTCIWSPGARRMEVENMTYMALSPSSRTKAVNASPGLLVVY
jgi:hypothetical protein